MAKRKPYVAPAPGTYVVGQDLSTYTVPGTEHWRVLLVTESGTEVIERNLTKTAALARAAALNGQ